jgi:DNA replication and repair protein RecF
MISKIELKDFRLFVNLTLDSLNPLVILSGKNATGKTSILEALYLCSTGKNHRTNDLSIIIKKDSLFSIIDITADRKYKYVISKGSRVGFINKSEVKKLSDFVGNLSVVMYSPDDISLVKGSKLDKRRFLDMEISLIDKTYLKTLNLYKKILAERNELLKQEDIYPTFLDVLTKSISEYTLKIYDRRILFINRLNEILKDITIDLNTENIRLIYKSTYNPKDVLDSSKKHEKSDLVMKSTGIGCHRDEFVIEMDGMDAEEYASEGQARLICIAVKLALKKYIEELTNKKPILLLDDVFAALDKSRISSLVKYINNSYQAFITTTSVMEIPDELLKNALVIRMEKKER